VGVNVLGVNLVCTELLLAIGAAGLPCKSVCGLNKGRQRSVWAQLRPAFGTVSNLDLGRKMHFPRVQEGAGKGLSWVSYLCCPESCRYSVNLPDCICL